MPPVIGSPSLKAISIGVGDAVSTAHAARFASLAGSSGRVGTSPGIARGAGLVRLVRERRVVGGAHRRRTVGRRQPAWTNRPMSSVGALCTAARNWCQISGMSMSPVGRPVFAATMPREPVGVLGGQAQADQAAPVLADERDAAQVEHVEGERAHPLDVAGVGVVLDRGRLVRAAEADQVRRDRAQPGRRPAPGSSCRYRNDQDGSPCSSSTGSPSAGPVLDPGHAQRPVRPTSA